MITVDAFVLKPDPELVKALWESGDQSCYDAWESVVCNEDDPQPFLHIEPEMAADWCESWFSESELDTYVTTGRDGELVEPAFCEDRLLYDFVQTILKIYRLTVSV